MRSTGLAAVLTVAAVASVMAMSSGLGSGGHPLLRDWRRHYRRWHDRVAEDLKPQNAGLPRGEAPVADPTALLNEFISGVPQCYGLVGLTAAVVSQGSESGQTDFQYRNGFGVRDMTSREPVDVNTLFGIGSTTKAFTATLLAAAVDAGMMNWTDPVRKYIPEFTMFDTWANASVTLKDAMCHRTGVPRYDAVWASGISETRPQGVMNVGHLKPNLPFRDQWQYNNWLWSTAGLALERATGGSWDGMLYDVLFTPLGMTQSSPNVTGAINTGNYASPNVYQPSGQYAPLPVDVNTVLDTIAPAGIISSNAVDMTQWILLHLGNGTFNGKQIVSAQNLAVTKGPYSAMGRGTYLPWSAVSETDQTYGFGWVNGQYRGYRQYWHDGGTLGHTSLLTFLPDVQTGVFVSTNGIQGYEELVNQLITEYAFDIALGLEPWLTVQSACAMKHVADAELRAAPKPVHPLLRREQQQRESDAAGALCDADVADARASWTELERDVHARCMAAVRDAEVAAPRPAKHPHVRHAAVHSAASPLSGTYVSPYAGVVTIGADGVSWTWNAVSGSLQSTAQPNIYLVNLTGWFALIYDNAQLPLAFLYNGNGQLYAVGMILSSDEAPYIFYGPQ